MSAGAQKLFEYLLVLGNRVVWRLFGNYILVRILFSMCLNEIFSGFIFVLLELLLDVVVLRNWSIRVVKEGTGLNLSLDTLLEVRELKDFTAARA